MGNQPINAFCSMATVGFRLHPSQGHLLMDIKPLGQHVRWHLNFARAYYFRSRFEIIDKVAIVNPNKQIDRGGGPLAFQDQLDQVCYSHRIKYRYHQTHSSGIYNSRPVCKLELYWFNLRPPTR